MLKKLSLLLGVLLLATVAPISSASESNQIPTLDPKTYPNNNMSAVTYASPKYEKYKEYDLAQFNPPIKGDPKDAGRIQLAPCKTGVIITCIESFSTSVNESNVWSKATYLGVDDEWRFEKDNFRLVAYRYDLSDAFFCKTPGNKNVNCTNSYNWFKMRIFASKAKGDVTNAFDGYLDNIFKVEIKVPKSKPMIGSPWFWARSWDSSIQVVESADSFTYSFQGKPVEVPETLIGPVNNDLFPPGVLSGYLRSGGKLSSNTVGGKRLIEAKVGDIYTGSQSAQVGTLKDFSSSESLGIAKTWYRNQIWSFDSSAFTFLDYCTKYWKNDYSGMISSNASVFSLRAPTFDKATGTLDFKIASTHFAEDGTTPNKGLYSISIPIFVAKCMWGSTLNPAQAKISITSDDGTPQVAVTSINIDGEKVTFTATNLHFSTPTVRVSISAPKKTANCVNAKKKSTPILANGKCPTGYSVAKV